MVPKFGVPIDLYVISDKFDGPGHHVRKHNVLWTVSSKSMNAWGFLYATRSTLYNFSSRNGFTINGKSYNYHLADGTRGLMGRDLSEGCCVCRSKTLVLIGVYSKGMKPGICSDVIMTMGDFFKVKDL